MIKKQILSSISVREKIVIKIRIYEANRRWPAKGIIESLIRRGDTFARNKTKIIFYIKNNCTYLVFLRHFILEIFLFIWLYFDCDELIIDS